MTSMIRTLLFGVGALALLAGIVLGIAWLRTGFAPVAPKTVDQGVAVLTATRPIASGTLLHEGDTVWRFVAMAKPPPDSFVHGVNSPAELVGALTRRDIARGEIVTTTSVLRADERGFLAAALTPGFRAVTLPVDAQQSASGLVLPGDRVDVILVQNITDALPAHKSVGETVLDNVRVVAVGHATGPVKKAAAPSGTMGVSATAATPESAIPATITLEVLPLDAARLTVAAEIGKLNLVLRPVGEADATASPALPVWAGDVTDALAATPTRRAEGAGLAGRHPSPRRSSQASPSPVLIIRGQGGGGS